MATIHISPSGVIIDTGDEVVMRNARGCILNRKKLNELGYGSVYKANGYWVLYDVGYSFSDSVPDGDEPMFKVSDPRMKILNIHYNPNNIDNYPPCAMVVLEDYENSSD